MTHHKTWLVPVGSFVLALAISTLSGPMSRKLLARAPAAETGDCTPVVPPGAPKKNASCDKFQKTTKNFTPGQPDPAGFPGLNPGEDAVTQCGMSPGVDVKFDVFTCTNPDGSCVAVAKARSIDAVFGGSATIWLPDPGTTPLLQAHEEGHADICEAACDACCQKLKKDIANAPEQSAPEKSSDCESAKAAAGAALEQAVRGFVRNTVQDCLNKEDQASKDYDDATDKGRKGDQKKEAKKYAGAARDAILGKK